jgi:hypothetical protein
VRACVIFEMGDSFCMTLVSNASLSRTMYVDNTVAKFKTKLAKPIELVGGRGGGGGYEMALKEIQFPVSFYNVLDGECYVQVLMRGAFPTFVHVGSQLENRHKTVWSLPRGRYTDVNDIVNRLNEIKFVKEKITFTYMKILDRVRVEVAPGALRIVLSPKLRAILGFPPLEDGYLQSRTAPHPVNLNANVPRQLLVYCDVVEPQLFGDSMQRVLKTVGITDVNEYGRMFVATYDNPDYVPILKTEFQTIEIDIRTSEDRPAPFEFGPSLVKVHVRRRGTAACIRDIVRMDAGGGITLVSNSSISKELFPSNTVARFTTRLVRPVELVGGDYEMALTEIQFPISFYNVGSSDYVVQAFFGGEDGSQGTERVAKALPRGNYTNIKQLVAYLNNFEPMKGNLVLAYDEDSNRVKAGYPEREIGGVRKNVQMSTKLRAMLGFALEGEHYVRDESASNPPNLFINVRSQLFVYCDVLEPQLFGDSAQRVLRTVGIPDVSKFGQLFVERYDNPDYVPILKTHFQTIEIDIRTFDDLPAPFVFGPSLVKVHIRKASSASRRWKW